MPTHGRSCLPGAEEAAPTKINNLEPDRSSVSELFHITERVRGALVLVVELPEGRHRRRIYLTAAAAERAMQRAQERGQMASIVLAELRPVAVVGDGR